MDEISELEHDTSEIRVTVATSREILDLKTSDIIIKHTKDKHLIHDNSDRSCRPREVQKDIIFEDITSDVISDISEDIISDVISDLEAVTGAEKDITQIFAHKKKYDGPRTKIVLDLGSNSDFEAASLKTSLIAGRTGTRGSRETARTAFKTDIDIKKVDLAPSSSHFISEKVDIVNLKSSPKRLFAMGLPGGNYSLKEDDNKLFNNSCKQNEKSAYIKESKQKKIKKHTIKNEKKVDRGESDETFSRIKMKKLKQKLNSENNRGDLKNIETEDTMMKN